MAENFVVTPWEVSGRVDYDRLIAQFGTQKVDSKLLSRMKKLFGELHPMLRRGVFFSHRDFDKILDRYEKKQPFALYTGRGPSGGMHLGHILPLVFTKYLQDMFKCDLYIQLTDDEKFLFSKKGLSLEDANKMAYDNMLDIIAVGFDPKHTFIFSDIDSIKTLYPTALKVAKHLTFSTAKAVFGYQNENNVGEIFFTSIQSVPAFLPSIKYKEEVPTLIPCAIDQDPHFRVTRDIAPKLGYPKPALIHSIFLPGLQEGGKMSSSEPTTAIYVTDTPELVTKKINNAFSGGRETIEEHRKHGGNPDIDIPYQYLRIFFEPDDKKLQKIHDDYKSGKLLSGEMKQICIEKINAFLAEHQKKREQAKKHINEFILKDLKP
jgi:tryptophanyl-tRNA synthetase